MNYKAHVLAVLVTASIAPFAMASDGTINFTGQLLAATCAVTVNGAASPATVTLPSITAGSLSATGKVAGQTNFNIKLTGCTGTATTATAFFEAGGGVDPVSGNLKNTGTATNVQLQLVDGTSNLAIKAGDVAQVTTNSRGTIASNAATLPYAVQYYATGLATAGTVLGTVTYSLNYQ
ncbi:type 1 fimbrial protein [Pseudomonas sp. CCM 7893]|uniref:Type 1 fimbrial protein n=1 Tax=Pseudomonas spelaei TaxID=1055469 RepID=A0A6I3VZ18_9PSED|nr:fimbrial protein [Pseudomonas spelaei]MUF03620.1 type 1 fimbrial protein [Pseudomonas spelaei]